MMETEYNYKFELECERALITRAKECVEFDSRKRKRWARRFVKIGIKRIDRILGLRR